MFLLTENDNKPVELRFKKKIINYIEKEISQATAPISRLPKKVIYNHW